MTNLVEVNLSTNALGTGKSTLKVSGNKIDDGLQGRNYTVDLKTSAGTIL